LLDTAAKTLMINISLCYKNEVCQMSGWILAAVYLNLEFGEKLSYSVHL